MGLTFRVEQDRTGQRRLEHPVAELTRQPNRIQLPEAGEP
jgi:hypothetical protein